MLTWKFCFKKFPNFKEKHVALRSASNHSVTLMQQEIMKLVLFTMGGKENSDIKLQFYPTHNFLLHLYPGDTK
jgi:hypothetical protein